MKQIRMARSIYEQIRGDLARPHPFSEERVGFAFIRMGTGEGDNRLLLVSDYLPLPDDAYDEDDRVGARVNSFGIRPALQKSLQTGEGILHVHMHSHFGVPSFSKVDYADMPHFARSFQNANRNGTHGCLLLSKDRMIANVWLPGMNVMDKPIEVTSYNIVGMPFSLFRGWWR